MLNDYQIMGIVALAFGLVCGFAAWWLMRPAVRQDPWAGIQPEMRPGLKTWVLGDKEAGTGEVLEACPTRGNDCVCPDCGAASLLAGPSGGMSQNVACRSCLHEFNFGMFDTPPLILERRGLMDMARASVFGITVEQYTANPNSGWEKAP